MCQKQIVSFSLQEDSSHVVDSRCLGCPVAGRNNILCANKRVVLSRGEPVTELDEKTESGYCCCEEVKAALVLLVNFRRC